jgi:dihydrofolate reductase
MGKIVVTNHLSLDGVMQAPASPDEDTRDGFARGGWAANDNDDVMGRVMAKGMSTPGSLLLGRRTYEHFFKVWPNRTDNPFTEVLDKTQKYVASRTLTEPLPWQNSTLVSGDATDAVRALKDRLPGDLGILGSGDLIGSLRRHHLIDTYVLMIHPVVLGSGRRLFPDGAMPEELRMTDSVTTTTGVVIATYDVA